MNIINKINLILKIINYNLKVVFANKFIYFLITAILFYLVIIGIMLFTEATPDTEDIYNMLIFPGILVMFYPIVYNIQSDKDARMLEIIFGIPNYRYKVYIVRFCISMLLLLVVLLLMAGFAFFAVALFPVFNMVGQLMYPLFFLACIAFLFSTIVKNGNGTAVVMVIIGLFFWFMGVSLQGSKWNLFLNPYNVSSGMNLTIWANVVSQNRLILVIGAIISILWGLINLQQREKFV